MNISTLPRPAFQRNARNLICGRLFLTRATACSSLLLQEVVLCPMGSDGSRDRIHWTVRDDGPTASPALSLWSIRSGRRHGRTAQAGHPHQAERTALPGAPHAPGTPRRTADREEISSKLWPDGTFVDYEHGVNSAVNRIREALGDKASSPRFVETLARRGYRFVAPVERIAPSESALPPVSEIAIPDGGRASGQEQPGVPAEAPEPTRPDSGIPGGASEGLVSGCADALRPVAVHVHGLLCRGVGKSGGD
jgi:hypothetical protein